MTKKTFVEIRNLILQFLSKKPATPTQIALGLKLDFRTVKRHLTWLKGDDKIKVWKKTNRKTYYKSIYSPIER